MAHPMLRGVAAAVDGGTVIRAATAGLAGIAAIGEAATAISEAAVQGRGLCDKRRQPPAHHSILSIHSRAPSDNSMTNAQQVPTDDRNIAPQVPTDDRSTAQLVPTNDRNTDQLLDIIKELTDTLNIVKAENLDHQNYMAVDLENAEKKLRAEFDKLIISNTESLLEDKRK